MNWVNVPMTDPGGGKGDHQPEHSEELAWQRIKIMGWYTNLGYHGSDNPLDYEHEGWRNPTGIRDHHKYIGEGIVRNYHRRMGLRLYYKCTGYDSNNNPTYASEVEPSNDEVTSIITNIQVDDRVEFFIQPGTEKLDEYIYTENSGVRVDDINSEIDSQREAADDAFDSATCIGCSACVAACPNASAMLFVSAKINHLGSYPQGQVEEKNRVLKMVRQMDKEGFGNCSNEYQCEVACPKGISVKNIAKMNKKFLKYLM